MSRAIYPGSFDPITNGHIDIIQRARKIFAELIVAIVANPNKRFFFTPEERQKLTEQVLEAEGIENVRVISYAGLLIDCAREQDADVIVRGLRAISDFEYEFSMASMNRKLHPDLQSVFFMTSDEYSFLSSSIVREVKHFGGDISAFVPAIVERALEKKLAAGR
ncbi:MAG: pantetheine-phosphate adenylyltransferase, partial [Candidatus Bipolaricaulia bacterium]